MDEEIDMLRQPSDEPDSYPWNGQSGSDSYAHASFSVIDGVGKGHVVVASERMTYVDMGRSGFAA